MLKRTKQSRCYLDSGLMWTWTKKRCLIWGPRIIQWKEALLRDITWASPDLRIIDSLNLIHDVAAVMQPLASRSVATCYCMGVPACLEVYVHRLWPAAEVKRRWRWHDCPCYYCRHLAIHCPHPVAHFCVVSLSVSVDVFTTQIQQ